MAELPIMAAATLLLPTWISTKCFTYDSDIIHVFPRVKRKSGEPGNECGNDF